MASYNRDTEASPQDVELGEREEAKSKEGKEVDARSTPSKSGLLEGADVESDDSESEGIPDDLPCKRLICCKCMQCFCRCINVTPFFSVATLIVMIVMIARAGTLYGSLYETLFKVFVVSDEIRKWLEFAATIMMISALMNMFVTLQSYMSSQFFLKNCCHKNEAMEGCCRRFCATLANWTHWTFLMVAFLSSYVATVLAIVLVMVVSLLPILAGLSYGACLPIYDAESPVPADVIEDTNHSLHGLFVIINDAKQHGLNEYISSMIDDVNLDTISHEETEDMCAMFSTSVSEAGWFFACCVVLVIMQLNFAVISRGNLVEWKAHERHEKEDLKKKHEAENEEHPLNKHMAAQSKNKAELKPLKGN